MDRRIFIKKTGKAVASVGIPFILPTGRLFAATGDRKVEHVVLCLFAGGIRNRESQFQEEGSLMRNMFGDNVPFASDLASSITSMPILYKNPIQKSGTLFKNFRFKSNLPLHYNAHAACVTGNYCNSVELMKPIKHPTIFEFFRKHSSPMGDAINSWWVTDQLGPFPYLKYSNHPLYGSSYGANMIQPTNYFKFPFLRENNTYHKEHLENLMGFVDNVNSSNLQSALNTMTNKNQIQEFLSNTYSKNMYPSPTFWGMKEEVNGDLVTMFTASEIINTFKPNLLVVNMQNSDIGHSNFTGYCKNMHKADFALAKLWQTIQEDVYLKDNTVLIAVPEFGRNKQHNTVKDENGRYAVDHTGDATSQEIFCFIGGPKHIVKQDLVIEETLGETIDLVPTIAHLLGFVGDIPKDLIPGRVLYEAFV